MSWNICWHQYYRVSQCHSVTVLESHNLEGWDLWYAGTDWSGDRGCPELGRRIVPVVVLPLTSHLSTSSLEAITWELWCCDVVTMLYKISSCRIKFLLFVELKLILEFEFGHFDIYTTDNPVPFYQLHYSHYESVILKMKRFSWSHLEEGFEI